MPLEWEMKAYIVSRDAAWLEGYLHTVFRDVRVKCEWFRLSETDLAALRPIMDISREDQIPEGLRRRHGQNAADLWVAGEERRSKWVYKDRPRREPEIEKPMGFPTIPELWVGLVKSGGVAAYCKKVGIPVPTRLVARIKRSLAGARAASCAGRATSVAAKRGLDAVCKTE